MVRITWHILEFYTLWNISATANDRDFKFCIRVGHVKSYYCDEWVFPKWAWSGTREQFLHCGLSKFRHSKSSVYNSSVIGLFMTPIRQWKATRSRDGFVHMFITHYFQLNLQLHNIDMVWTYRRSSFCTFAWQLARFQLARRIARSLGDSWAFCTNVVGVRTTIYNRLAYRHFREREGEKDCYCLQLVGADGAPCELKAHQEVSSVEIR